MEAPAWTLRARVAIIGSGPAAHTAAIYAVLEPVLFEVTRPPPHEAPQHHWLHLQRAGGRRLSTRTLLAGVTPRGRRLQLRHQLGDLQAAVPGPGRERPPGLTGHEPAHASGQEKSDCRRPQHGREPPHRLQDGRGTGAPLMVVCGRGPLPSAHRARGGRMSGVGDDRGYAEVITQVTGDTLGGVRCVQVDRPCAGAHYYDRLADDAELEEYMRRGHTPLVEDDL